MMGITRLGDMPGLCVAGRRTAYEKAKSALREPEEDDEGPYALMAARTRARRTALDSVSMS
jgi:hypothetical protein